MVAGRMTLQPMFLSDPQDERHSIAHGEEWERSLDASAHHLKWILLVCLEWPDADMHWRDLR